MATARSYRIINNNMCWSGVKLIRKNRENNPEKQRDTIILIRHILCDENIYRCSIISFSYRTINIGVVEPVTQR